MDISPGYGLFDKQFFVTRQRRQNGEIPDNVVTPHVLHKFSVFTYIFLENKYNELSLSTLHSVDVHGTNCKLRGSRSLSPKYEDFFKQLFIVLNEVV